MPTVVLVEFPEDVEAVASAHSPELALRRVVCLSPAAIARAAELRAPARSADAYIDSLTLQDAGADHFARVEALCDVLDAYLRASTEADTVSARMFFKNLKVMYDTVSLRVLQVRAVLEAEKPSDIVYFDNGESLFDDRLLFGERDSIYARVIPLCASVVCPAATVNRRVSAATHRERLPRRLKRLAMAVRSWYRNRRPIGRQERRREGAICVVETGYGLDAVLPDLAKSMDIVFWRPAVHHGLSFGRGLIWSAITRLRGGVPPHAASQYAEAWRAADSSSELRSRFDREGISFYHVVRSRLRFLVTDMLPRAAIMRAECERYLERRPDLRAVFSVNFSFEKPWTQLLALAARRRKVPVVTYQHSAFGYFCWPYSKYVDELMADYRLVWGAGSARFMREDDPTGCEPVVVGSLELQQIRKQIRANPRPARRRPLIVYPIAGHTGNRFYFAHHRMTDTETFELTKSVLAVLGAAGHADVIVKLYPGQSDYLQRATQAWLDARGWRHVRTVATGNYSRLVADADLIVIDSPSTVLVQSVLGSARLIVYTGVYRMVDAGLAMLRRRAEVFSDRTAFLDRLQGILDSRDFDNGAYRSNDFVREYCGDPAANPAVNVVAALERIVAQRADRHLGSADAETAAYDRSKRGEIPPRSSGL